MNYVWIENEAARRRANYDRLRRAAKQRRIELGLEREEIPGEQEPGLRKRDFLYVASIRTEERTPAPDFGIVLPAPPEPQWKRIIKEVAQKHRIGLKELLGAQRSVPIVRARHEAMYRLSKETTMSLPAIGRRLNKDHTTVLHGIRQHQSRMAQGEAA